MPRERNLLKIGKTWYLRYEINGRERRESLRTSDVKIARTLRDKKLAEYKAHFFHGNKHITWLEVVAQWAGHIADQILPSTAKRYAVSLAQCEPWLKSKLITEIDGKLLNEMIAGRKAAGASTATIRRDLTAISRVLEFAEAHDMREGNPTLSKRRLQKERRDPIHLPLPESIAAIMEAASKRFGALIQAALLTGCRQDELVQMKWRQFNTKTATLDVIGKGNKRRTISLDNEAFEHFSMQAVIPGSEFIFCRENGEKFTQAASDFGHIRRIVEARSRKEGSVVFSRFRFHDLRHLFAVNALRSGIDIYTLSKHLGHTSVKTTEIYLEFLTPEKQLTAKHGPVSKTVSTTAVSEPEKQRKLKAIK